MDGPEGAKTLPWERRVTHAMSLIVDFLKDDRVVLLRCEAGKHRSGFVGALTLAVLRNLTWDEAKDILIETRGFYNSHDKQIITQMGRHLDAQGFVQDFRGTLRFAAPKVYANLGVFLFARAFRRSGSMILPAHRSPGMPGLLEHLPAQRYKTPEVVATRQRPARFGSFP